MDPHNRRDRICVLFLHIRRRYDLFEVTSLLVPPNLYKPDVKSLQPLLTVGHTLVSYVGECLGHHYLLQVHKHDEMSDNIRIQKTS